jgi:hypothetical protein
LFDETGYASQLPIETRRPQKRSLVVTNDCTRIGT